MKNNKQQNDKKADLNNKLQEADRTSHEEKGKKVKVTMVDIKGKKVDGDPELESDQPVEQKTNDE